MDILLFAVLIVGATVMFIEERKQEEMEKIEESKSEEDRKEMERIENMSENEIFAEYTRDIESD